MSQKEINIINNKENLFSPVCPVLDSQEYGGLDRSQRGKMSVCVLVCVLVCVCVREGRVGESQKDRHRWSESEGMSDHRLTNPA